MDSLDALLQQIAQMPPWLACVTIVIASFLSEDLAVIGAGLAAVGLLSPLIAAILMPTSSITVVLGSWYSHTFTRVARQESAA